MVFFDDFGHYISSNKDEINNILFEDVGGLTKGDSFLVKRSNHEGEQPISSITNLQSKLDSKVDKMPGRDLSDENFTKTKKQKLEHVQEKATKNQPDEFLLERSNHTGMQPIESINDLQQKLDSLIEQLSVVGNGVPIGCIISYTSAEIIPENYLLCDGKEFDVELYSDLFEILKKNTTPDLRNRFLRGVGNLSSDLLQLQDYATARPKTSDFTTNTTGNHSHKLDTYSTVNQQTGPSAPLWNYRVEIKEGFNTSVAGNHSHTITGGGDEETRPINVAVVFLIRAK